MRIQLTCALGAVTLLMAACNGPQANISPDNPAYDENGAPRAGAVPDVNTPYAPMHSEHPGGHGQG